MFDPLAPQSPPKPGHGDVWRDVIRATVWWVPTALLHDFAARREQGIARYGTTLQYDNGRDPWIDAFQEALDLVAYLWQARAPWWMRWGAVGWAWLLSRRVPR